MNLYEDLEKLWDELVSILQQIENVGGGCCGAGISNGRCNQCKEMCVTVDQLPKVEVAKLIAMYL